MSKKLLLAFWCTVFLLLFPGVVIGSPGTREPSSSEFTFEADWNVALNADQIQTDSIYVVKHGAPCGVDGESLARFLTVGKSDGAWLNGGYSLAKVLSGFQASRGGPLI